MQKTLLRKGIAFTVILLFIGVSIIPSVSTIVEKKSNTLTFNDGSLSGYVNDTSMNPIEGARLRVCFHGTYEENNSDSSGYYHVTNIPICNCTKNCTAFKEGYKPECVWLSIYEDTIYDFVLTPSKTLYVGGSGEGNYSKIQDAIDNASDGDTVFVYNGTYIEILKVDKTINLIGENRDNTIIDANREIDAIYIYAPNVNIVNFKIQNAFRAGINLNSNTSYNINISNNIFCFNGHGIHPYFSNKNLIISNNIFVNNNNGFTLVCSSNAIIYNNKFINNSLWAMGLYLSSNCDVFHNNITHGQKYGIFLYGLSHSNYFHQNNFINNSMNAYFILLSHRNKWNENYWEKTLIPFYPIIGSLGLLIPCWLNFDWRPVKEPYDIEV